MSAGSPDAAVVDVSAVDAESASDSGPPTVEICDGSSSVRFVYQLMGGGQVLPGSQVLIENGFSYLIITGTCEYWVMSDPWSDVRTGHLDEADELSFANEIRTNQWGQLKGGYSLNACDGGSPWFKFIDKPVFVRAECNVEDQSAEIGWLWTAVRKELPALYAAGTPVASGGRLVLVDEPSDTTWPSSVEASAALWPNATPASSIAISLDSAGNYQPGSSVPALSSDATNLRDIRRRLVAQGILPLSGGFLPIKDPMGQRYQLFVRDVNPFQDANGLQHFFQ